MINNIDQSLSILDKYWEKQIVYTYDPNIKNVSRKGNEVTEGNKFIESRLIFIGDGTYKFKFLPDEEYDNDEGCLYRCSNCTDEDPEVMPIGDEDVDYLEECYYENIDHYGFCSSCRLKDFKHVLRQVLVDAAPWCDESYDDHCCIFDCGKSVIDKRLQRDFNNIRSLTCKSHCGTTYQNLENIYNDYIKNKRESEVSIYNTVIKFLECPVPKEIRILVNTDTDEVVPAKLYEDNIN